VVSALASRRRPPSLAHNREFHGESTAPISAAQTSDCHSGETIR
jgi:hypothetical protein